MKHLFSADLHLGHANIIKYANRPFKNVEEMDKTIIANINAVAGKGDKLYLLGDTCFTGRDLRHYLKQISCDVIFINGNHDPKQFDRDLVDYRTDVKMIQVEGQNIWLSHYAHRVWPQAHYGAWHLYGHTHGLLPDYGYSCDVGVDAWNYKPVTFEQLKARFAGRDNPHALVKTEGIKEKYISM